VSEPFLKLANLSKRFGTFPAVVDLSIDVARGEALTLLGPSGCGKTTTLRMIAGLERPDSGAIHLDGKPLVSVERGIDLPPERRGMGMVFQSYAIWPNMTVAGNVAFPLTVRRVPQAEIRARVSRALEMVGLGGLEDRPATSLSGGQQQRVALARALVYEPQILLLDEPLSNLDVKLREQMRVELKLLQNRLGLTLIYVTHDQSEALGLSDRIAVLNRGRIEQIGSPMELYERPCTPFARDFLGKSVRLPGRIESNDGQHIVVALDDANGAKVQCKRPVNGMLAPGAAVEVSVRPESVGIHTSASDAGIGALKGIVEAVLYQGDHAECEVRIGGQSVLVFASPKLRLSPSAPIILTIAPESASVWPR
jgi:ABC-type Fe3+/spermidine/putrescine transport system ATPase subunit